jgi:hypothetical protein
MTTLAPERSVDEIVLRWRRGDDEEGWDNPAGPRFLGEFAEAEITRTGGFTQDPHTMGSTCTAGWCAFCC